MFLLSSIALSMTAATASDWEEESGMPHRAPAIASPPGPEQAPPPLSVKAGSETAFLQGSASTIRTRIPSYQTLAAQSAARVAELQRIDAEATPFLASAVTDQIVQPAVFRAFLEKNHPGTVLSAASAQDLVLAKGRWDDSSKPLRAYGLSFQSIKTKQLEDYSLSNCKVLILDCAGEIPRAAVQKVRDFVGNGGYLISTDWALQNVIERAFPGFVQWSGDKTDGVITDAFVIEADPSLLKGFSGRRFTWKLDRQSQCVRILNPSRVHIIARSSRLAHQDSQYRVLPDQIQAGALALEFEFGRGKVLHLVGHFDNCSNSFRPYLLPDPAPGAGVSLRQGLAGNFIMEALSKAKAPAH
ncbi:MAG: hypothetical protein K2X27_14480 [Candidatus Obscuribacterales bacterium]|nr:hypothetical protein [Candidatus Obscuribacterales bacterium]